LKNKGFERNTRQREIVLDELMKAKDHPTAAMLYERVRAQLPRISLGTVYRNLERLTRAGEIRRLDLAGAETRFDADTSRHYHVRCTECGRLDDVHEITGDLVGERFAELGGYRITGYQLEFRGICPTCRAQADDTS
jgi:Fur family ferric uptake transcriptional regulator